MEQFLKENEIIDIVKEYVENKNTGYAIMIDGEWGSGKTYFVREKLEKKLKKLWEETKREIKFIYVSSYGVKSTNELDSKIKKQLCENLINFKLDIIGTNGFDRCQVCSGGVSLEEINTCTMESKIQKSLYVTGEIIDIFGDCGGYNLAFAWISGMIAGINVGNNND